MAVNGNAWHQNKISTLYQSLLFPLTISNECTTAPRPKWAKVAVTTPSDSIYSVELPPRGPKPAPPGSRHGSLSTPAQQHPSRHGCAQATVTQTGVVLGRPSVVCCRSERAKGQASTRSPWFDAAFVFPRQLPAAGPMGHFCLLFPGGVWQDLCSSRFWFSTICTKISPEF